VACLVVLSFFLVYTASSFVIGLIGVAGLASLLKQAGVVEWMGSLYGNGYSLGLCFAAIGIGLGSRPRRWVIFTLSFVSGWMGYDFLFCFLGCVALTRWLVHAEEQGLSRGAFRAVVSDILVSCLGVVSAIVAHIGQNALYFGSISAAFNDLIGSAAARAGLQVAEKLNPTYAAFIDHAAKIQGKGADGEYSRWLILRDLFESFLTPEWSNVDLGLLAYGVIGGVFFFFLCLYLICRGTSLRSVLTEFCVMAIAFTIVIVSGLAWFVLMPQHARFHFHFIQRQFFVPLFLGWIVLWQTTSRLRREIGGDDRSLRWF